MTRRQTSPRSLRIACVAVVAATALLGGCSQMSPQTTQLQYAASDGVMGESGPLSVRNLLLVTDDAGQQATVVGTLVNSSDQKLSVELGTASGGPGTAPIEVEAGGVVTLTADGQRIVVPIQSGAGTLVPFVLTAGGTQLSLNVPVLDATLPEYSTLTPGTK